MKIKLNDGGIMPLRAHKTDAGLDFFTPVDVVIFPHSVELINTHVCMAIDEGWVGSIHPRSSLYSKGIDAEGQIDSGYRGEIRIMLTNNTDQEFRIPKESKIAQMILTPCFIDEIEVTDNLDDTERGSGGFGSTGR